MKERVFLIAVLLWIGWVPVTEAGMYLGLSAGHSEVEDLSLNAIDDGSLRSGAVDDANRTWKLILGYQIMPYLAVEASWMDHLLATQIDAVSDGTEHYGAGLVEAKGRTRGWTTEVLLMWPVLETVSVYGKAGAVRWESKSRLTNSAFGRVLSHRDGTDGIYGAGVRYRLHPRMTLQGEWQRVSLKDADVNMDGDVFWGGLLIGLN